MEIEDITNEIRQQVYRKIYWQVREQVDYLVYWRAYSRVNWQIRDQILNPIKEDLDGN